MNHASYASELCRQLDALKNMGPFERSYLPRVIDHSLLEKRSAEFATRLVVTNDWNALIEQASRAGTS